jgi:aspartyl-tRNA(Asn)/glutamyl-tRNA(Gln) amidotransferase subunit A
VTTPNHRAEDLCYLDAVTARRAFSDLTISPVELLRAIITRAEAVEGDRTTGVNAFVHRRFEQALQEAERAAATFVRLARSGEPAPPLLGLPVATKEKHGIAGEPLEEGLLGKQGLLAGDDHPVVRRVLAAGGIIHARTSTPEFSCATVTHSRIWGVTRNPWNLACTPGGSSGGAGASLAAGTTTLATASDIAGSTRVPAGFTGTAGYKAPYGRIPGLQPLAADWYRGDGPMARTVADCALLAGVLSGRHPFDHASFGVPENPLELRTAPADAVRGMRIGISTQLGNYPVAAEIVSNTVSVATALQAAGAQVVEIEPPWTTTRIRETLFAHLAQIFGPALERAAQGSDDVSPYTVDFIRTAREAAARYSLLDSLAMDARIQAELATAMSDVDVLLCPTSAVTSLPADGDFTGGITVGGRHLDHYWESHLTSVFNTCNKCPVLAVPSGVADSGVPTGLQIVGHPYDEATVFRVGAAVEALHPLAAPWPRLVA